MSWTVRVSAQAVAETASRFGAERSGDGRADEYDFVAGPLAAAVIECRYFDELPEAFGPAVRAFHILDPVFGPVVFTVVALEGTSPRSPMSPSTTTTGTR